MSYSKLSSFSRGFYRYRWYAGAGHLLLAQQLTWRVEYRRIFFDDIQTIVLYSTRRDKIRAGLWSAAAALLGWLFFALHVAIAGWITVACGMAAISAELILGPFGQAEIRTETSDFRFPLASRMRKNRKVAAQIKTLVEAAQGEIALPGGVDFANAPRAESPLAAAAGQKAESIAPRRWSWFFWAATIALGAQGGRDLLALWQPQWFHGRNWLVILFSAITFLFLLISAIHVFQHRAMPGIRAIGLTYVLSWPLFIVVSIVIVFTHLALITTPAGKIWLHKLDHRISVIAAILDLALAAVGALWSFIQKGHFAAAPVAAASPGAAEVSVP